MESRVPGHSGAGSGWFREGFTSKKVLNQVFFWGYHPSLLGLEVSDRCFLKHKGLSKFLVLIEKGVHVILVVSFLCADWKERKHLHLSVSSENHPRFLQTTRLKSSRILFFAGLRR